MALALNNLKRVDIPLNKETKPNQTKSSMFPFKVFCFLFFLLLLGCIFFILIRYMCCSLVFANGQRDRGSTPGRVIPKTQKMILDAFLLNTQHYKVRTKGKWSSLEKGITPSSTPRCSSYWKGGLRVAFDYSRPTYIPLGKAEPPYSPSSRLKCTITTLPQGWIWH